MYPVSCQPAPSRRDQAAVMGVGSGAGVNEPVYMWITSSSCSRSHSPTDTLAPHAGRLPFLFATPPPPHVPPLRHGTLPQACDRRAPSAVVARCRIPSTHRSPAAPRTVIEIVQVHRRVFQGAPQQFDEHVVQTPTATVHRAAYPRRLQQSRERDTGELAARKLRCR